MPLVQSKCSVGGNCCITDFLSFCQIDTKRDRGRYHFSFGYLNFKKYSSHYQTSFIPFNGLTRIPEGYAPLQVKVCRYISITCWILMNLLSSAFTFYFNLGLRTAKALLSASDLDTTVLLANAGMPTHKTEQGKDFSKRPTCQISACDLSSQWARQHAGN